MSRSRDVGRIVRTFIVADYLETDAWAAYEAAEALRFEGKPRGWWGPGGGGFQFPESGRISIGTPHRTRVLSGHEMRLTARFPTR